jgi:hypothetical protein
LKLLIQITIEYLIVTTYKNTLFSTEISFSLKAVFLELSPAEFSVCIEDNGIWFHFFKSEVQPIDFNSIVSLKMKVSMLWYFYKGDNHFPIPAALQALVEHDNRSYSQKI